MYWHIDTDIISVIVIAAIYVYYVRVLPKHESPMRRHSFLTCLRVGMIVTLIDIAASLAMEMPVSRFAYHLLMTLYFAAIELPMVAWLCYAFVILYADDERRRAAAAKVTLCSYALYALIAVSNPFTGVLFTLSADGVYQRGPLFAMMVAVYAVYALALLALVIIRRNKVPAGYSLRILVLLPVVMAVSIAAQLLNGGWLMIMPGYMVSLVMAFLFLQTSRARDNQKLVANLSIAAMTDKLTGLYNRAGLDYMVRLLRNDNAGQCCLVLFADIDDLKLINDTLGHAEGDRAIVAVAKQLKSHFRASDVVARFGGDEFVAYLIGDWTELRIHRSLKSLVEEIAAQRVGEDGQCPIHGSVGAATGIVGEDGFERLCARADAALYHVKRHGKRGFALYEPSMDGNAPGQADSAKAAEP